MSYQIKWYPDRVHRIYTGQVSGWDLLRSSLDVYSRESFDKIDFQIIDFSNAKKLKITRQDLQSIDPIERAAKKSNWTLSVFIVMPDYHYDEFLWLVDEYGKETEWRVKRFASQKEAFERIGYELTTQFRQQTQD